MIRAPGILARLRRRGAPLGRFVGLALVISLFTVLDRMNAARNETDPTFLTLSNFRTVASQTVIVAIAALGAGCVIISAGIDLSVGAVIALTTVVTALSLEAGHPPALAVALGIGAAGACGFLNGTMITALRIVPFIVTLGMMSIARGVAKLLAKETSVYPPPSWIDEVMMPPVMPETFSAMNPGHWLRLFPPGVWVLIVLAILTSLLLRRTVAGRHIFATGSSEAAARLCGIPVGRVRIMVYTLAGLLAGVAGIMQFSRLTVGDPTAAAGLELDIIAAVVIGGGSLFGGEGSVSGTLVGAFTLQFLRNGCNLLGVNNYVQEIIIGVIIIGAVAADGLRRNWISHRASGAGEEP